MALGSGGGSGGQHGRWRQQQQHRTAPNRTYSEQVTRLFGTEQEDDMEGSSSHNSNSHSNSNGDDPYNTHTNGYGRRTTTTTTTPAAPSGALPSSHRSYVLTGSSPPQQSTSRRSSTGDDGARPVIHKLTTLLGAGGRRVSAPSFSSNSAVVTPSSSSQLRPSASATVMARATAAAYPSSPSTTQSRQRIAGSSSNSNSNGKRSNWIGLLYVMVISLAGFGLGALRHRHQAAQGQLQHELRAALEEHDALATEVQELRMEVEAQQQRASEQERLESTLQLLNAELEETERSLSDERTKLEHRKEELERLVRAEHATHSRAGAEKSSGLLRHHHYDAATATGAGASNLMMMTSIDQVLPASSMGGEGEDVEHAGSDSLVGRLVQTLGVEHYGLRPLHVELHLEYHHQTNPSSALSNSKKTSIHRRYVTAQVSLLQRPITTFVFLQQVEHDLYDRVKLRVEEPSGDDDKDSKEGARILRTELSDRQKRHRKALGLGHVPVREVGSYHNPVLLDKDAAKTTTNETVHGNETETDTDTTEASERSFPPQDRPHHYHFALTDDGDLVISTSISRPGVFATLVHGDPVLDKLLMPKPHNHTGSSDSTQTAAANTKTDTAHPAHHHHHHTQHVELISIRLLSSLDDEDHNSSEDDDDDEEDEEEEEEEGLTEWLHDEH